MNRLLVWQVLAVASFNLAPIVADGAPITVPTGLNPGDQYRLVFVTSTTRNAESADIEEYNTFVTSAANSVPELAALGTTWKAIGSTFEIDARDNTNTNFMNPGNVGVPIYTVGDTLLAVNNGDLWDGSIANMLAFTEHGNFLSTFAWTGTAPDGTAAFVEFFPPAFLGGGPGVMRGVTTSTALHWVAAGNAGVSSSQSLYAMSGVLTVVPEPSAFFSVSIGGIALVVAMRRRRRATIVLALLISAACAGHTQAAPLFTANTGGSVHGFVSASESGPLPVSVSGSGINSGGAAMGNASSSPGSLSAFAKLLQPSGAQPQVSLSSTGTFRIDNLVFSLASGTLFTPGTSFTTSLNYGLSGGIDLSGMNTTGGVTIAMSIGAFNVNIEQSGSFSAIHSLHDYGQVTEGAWVINRSGLLSSFATDLEAVGGNTAAPTLVAYDELLFTSPSFTLTASGSGVIASPSVFMRLTAGVGGPRFRGNFASATSDFGNTLNFATSGPVFNLPDGITVNSTDGLIVDNRWFVVPEPSSLMMLGTGAAWVAGLVIRRKRRTAVSTPG